MSSPPTTTLSYLDRPGALVVAGEIRSGTVRSLRQDAWRRFRRNHLAMLGGVYIALLIGVAVTAPVISPQNPVQTDICLLYTSPSPRDS